MEEISNQINFFAEDIDLPFAPTLEPILHQWAIETAQAEGCTTAEVSFVFCSDDFLLHINQTELEHDFYTDVITFPFHDDYETEPIEGDIYISVDRVRENAATENAAPLHELCRVMIHGILHLCGYDDETPELRQKMHEKENHYLAKIEPLIAKFALV